MKSFRWLLTVSRPRFWPYLSGPFLIGLASAGKASVESHWLMLVCMGIYFLFPANLLIYGINDIYDYETDKKNPKKQGYEALVTPKKHNFLASAVAVANYPFILGFLFWQGAPVAARVGLALFLVTGVGYSAPPIRAKAKPFLDTLFNSLYVFPAFVSYGILTGKFPPLALFLAATAWCMAMHAYSAIPDIDADKRAKIATVATVLGTNGTLLFCALCYVAAAVLSANWMGLFSVAVGVLYLALVGITFAKGKNKVLSVYKIFPKINLIVGVALFWFVYFWTAPR